MNGLIRSAMATVAILFVFPLFAEDVSSTTFLLPVNAVSRPRLNLEVRAPSGFDSLQPLADFLAERTNIFEMVPHGQGGGDWTEIVTLDMEKGRGFEAESFVEELIAGAEAVTASYQLLYDESYRSADYEYAAMAIAYRLNGRREVLVARYYSGPYDLSGVQYTIRPSGSESDAEVVKKIDRWLDQNTNLIEF